MESQKVCHKREKQTEGEACLLKMADTKEVLHKS